MRPAQYRQYRVDQRSPAEEFPSLTHRRRDNETAEEYQRRLDLGCAGMIGLLEQYEKRARLERSQQLFPYSRKVDEEASEEVARGLTSLIKDFYTQLCLYEAQFPALSRKREIRQRKRQLEKILSS